MDQQRLCLACGTSFEVPATSKRQYCSVACHPRQTHSRSKRPPVTVECDQCGKRFQRKAWEVEQRKRKGWALYCSTECRDAVKKGRKGQRRSVYVDKVCEHCGKPFSVQPNRARTARFCSKTCASRGIARGRRPMDTRTINGHGYAFVYVPMEERPLDQRRIARHPEHRVVMRDTLGRWPEPWETVHHINGDKLDNRPENLQLRVGNHGKGLVLRCRGCGSSDIETVELE